MADLEAQIKGLEEERTTLRANVGTLRDVQKVLEEEIQEEWDLSNTVACTTWNAMVVLEGTVAELGAVPPRNHKLAQMDVTLARLQNVGEVFLPVARVYGDHRAKMGWLTALASLDKEGYAHLDAIATRSVAMATTEEVASSYCRTRRSSNVLLQDFWTLRGSKAVMTSLREAQTQRARGKALMDGEWRATNGDQV